MNDDVLQDSVYLLSSTEPLTTTDTRSQPDQFERLRRRIHATRTIRFRSHIRLERRHKLSSYVIALLSMFVIAISVMPNIFLLDSRQGQVLLACTIVVSTFIICLVLTEGSESFYHKACVLHENARKLNELSFDLTLEVSPSVDRMREITNSYNDILQECPLNHAHCDYLWVKAQYPEQFGIVPPYGPLSVWSRFARRINRSWDWLQAVGSEFAWVAIPTAVCIATAFSLYSVVMYGWPDKIFVH
jgi:hypothetical protein